MITYSIWRLQQTCVNKELEKLTSVVQNLEVQSQGKIPPKLILTPDKL